MPDDRRRRLAALAVCRDLVSWWQVAAVQLDEHAAHALGNLVMRASGAILHLDQGAHMPTVSARARTVIDRVLAVLETGADLDDGVEPYASIGDRRDGAGLTGGKHQATDRANSLDAIVEAYAARTDATYPRTRDDLAAFLPWLNRGGSIGDGRGNLAPDDAETAAQFSALFAAAALDPAMRAAQDATFDRVYWLPAVEVARGLGLRTNLGHLVIYDTSIHSGGDGETTANTTADAVWNIRKRFAAGPPGNLPEGADRAAKQAHRDAEATWVQQYVATRGAWLRSAFAEGSPAYVSAYRCDALARLVSAGNWRLQTPLEVHLPHKVVRLA